MYVYNIAKLRKVHSRGSKLENCRILNGKNPCCCLPEIDSALEFEKSAMSLFVCVCLEIIMKMILFFFVLSDENFFVFDFISFFLVGFFWCNKSYQYFSILCVISRIFHEFLITLFFPQLMFSALCIVDNVSGYLAGFL